jgi:leucyl-tRNA synthetase
VSASDYPECDGSKISGPAEYGEELIRSVISDIGQILKVTGMDAKKVILYTSSEWKIKLLRMAAGMSGRGELDIPSLTKAAMADDEIRKNGKTASDLAKKFATDIMRNVLVADTGLNEYGHLKDAEAFIASEIGTAVEVVRADSAEYDPQNKARMAVPGRPAIYLE